MRPEPGLRAQMQAIVHPSSIVEPGAELGAGVRIGPFCHVGPDVRLAAGVELKSHVVVTGATSIGEGTVVFPQAVLGEPPQNVRHKGGRTTLTIGRDCVIREAVTAHAGTDTSRGATAIGDGCMLMAYSHVAHDCIVGNNVTFANGATLAGHCEVGDGAILGGLSAVHQFVRIGHHAFVGGTTGIPGDVIPYGMAIGNRARLRGLNIVGLKRSGATRQELQTLRAAYRMLFDRARPVADNVEAVRAAYGQDPRVADILDFVTSRGKRMFCVPAVSGAHDGDDED
ncbi:MAG: acyl-ACP--UDP-N-acetylglucosamine O-acyltransferase [Rhizobiales bacterium]|mgnify:CR=1 FL=1|nr:acyl-ACP--UDP-N-acetylglucosamine O-acyltransferase [Hyphomicrobiales bacterium]